MSEGKENDPNYKKIMEEGHDFSLKVDDQFRERLINELRTYPNVFLICCDETNASHSIQIGTKEQHLGRAFVSIMRKHPQVKAFIIQCLKDV